MREEFLCDGRNRMQAHLPPHDGIAIDAELRGERLLREAELSAEGFEISGGHAAI